MRPRRAISEKSIGRSLTAHSRDPGAQYAAGGVPGAPETSAWRIQDAQQPSERADRSHASAAGGLSRTRIFCLSYRATTLLPMQPPARPLNAKLNLCENLDDVVTVNVVAIDDA